MTAPLAFWAVAVLAGVLAWPISARVFRRFSDGGAGLSFAAGVTLAGYLFFTLRAIDVFPAGKGGALLALATLGVASTAVALSDRRLLATTRRAAPGILTAVGLFTMLFFGFVAFRSYTPEIVGTEQPMDLMYLNSAMTSPDYPPEDLWLGGERASYYYFGYVQVGLLSLVADEPATTGYNLGLAYVLAASGAAMASLALALARWWLRPRGQGIPGAAAAVSVVLLLGAGTLWGVFALAAAHERYESGLFEAFGVESLLPCEPGEAVADCYAGPSPRTDRWYPTEYFWWFQGTRVIPGTITEFPVFSFILGDLHPHLMSIPLVLLVVALAAATWRERGPLSVRSLRRGWPLALLLALMAGALAFQNAWDLVTFTLLLVLAIGARNWRAGERGTRLALDTAGYFGPVALVAVIAYLPWLLDFSSQAGGIYPYTLAGTRPPHLFLQFGPVIVPALVAGVLVAVRMRAGRREAMSAAWLTSLIWMVPLVAWLALCVYHGQLDEAVDNRGAAGWVTMVVLAGLCWFLATVTALAASRSLSASLVAAVATLGVLLLYGSELLLVKDVFFGGDLARMNTVFKLSYQAWILLSLAGGIGIVAAFEAARQRPALLAAAAPAGLVLVLSLVYGLAAVPARTDGFAGESELDGIAFVAASDPDEYALTVWIRDTVDAGQMVVEATGRTWSDSGGQPSLVSSGVDYTDAGRLSARTGRPTLIGWVGHEIQWRGGSQANSQEFTNRQNAVDALYLSPTTEEAAALLAEIGADYVAVGRLELVRYPDSLLTDFASFMDIVFESGELRVYGARETQVTGN